MDEQTFDQEALDAILDETPDQSEVDGYLEEFFDSLTESAQDILEQEASTVFTISNLEDLAFTDTPDEEILSEAPINTAEKTGKAWRVVVIESGISDNSNWYRPKTLRESIPAFEGAPIRIYEFDPRQNKQPNDRGQHNDHLPGWASQRDAGNVTGNTVAFIENVRLEDIKSTRIPGRRVPALTADLRFIDTTTQNRLLEAKRAGRMEPGKRALFQLSIEAEGPHVNAFTEGRQVRQVEAITRVREVTIVSEGAAGGMFLDILESSEAKEEIEQTFDNSTDNDILEDIDENSFWESFADLIQEALPEKENDMASTKGKVPKVKVNTSKVDPKFKTSKTPDDEEDEDSERSDIEKAIAAARSGDIENCIEVLQDMNGDNDDGDDDDEADDDEEDDDEDESDSKDDAKEDEDEDGEETRNNSLSMTKKPEQKSKFKKSKTVKKESLQMEDENEYGGDESEQGYSAQDIQDFAEYLAAQDAEREVRFQEAMARLAQHEERLTESDISGALYESAQRLQFGLRNSGLPKKTQTLIAEMYEGKIFEDSELKRDIERQRKYLESMQESMSPVYATGNGAQQGSFVPSLRVQMGSSPADYISAEFDRAFGYEPAQDNTLTESKRNVYKQLPLMPSIRRPMMMWHDDPDCRLTGYVGPNAVLREATSLDMPILLQNSMTKALLQRYMSQPALWREISTVVPIANFLEQQRIIIGGLGLLPQVVEANTGVTYLSLGFPSSAQVKYTVGTFGGLIKITRQAIINDNLQGIQRYPQEAAESAVMTLNQYVFGTAIGKYGTSASGAINTALSYDGKAYYHANHDNLTNAAMSYSSLIDMWNRLREQRRFANATTLNGAVSSGTTFVVTDAEFAVSMKAGDKIKIDASTYTFVSYSTATITVSETITASHLDLARVEQLGPPIAFDSAKLIHPTQLSATAYQMLASALLPGSTTNDANALLPAYEQKKLVPMDIHSMYLGGDLNNYYMIGGKPVEVGFLGGKEDPELLLQDNPLVNNVFSGDLISWKVRHEHGEVLTDHHYVSGAIVA